MAKVRLLELRNTYKWGGGPDKTILLSAQQHDPARVSVVVAYIRDVRDHEFQIADMARGRGINYHEIPERGKFDPKVLTALRKLILEYDINLIHGHDYKSDFFAYMLKGIMWPRPLAVVSTAHAWVMLGARGAFYRKLDLFLMKRFDHLFAVSKATQDEMVEAGIRESKITVIHNGIDTKMWCPSEVRETLRDELLIAPTTPIVGYVGRIMPEKDLETWLRAAALVSVKHPETRYVLVGEGRDGTTLHDLQSLATSLGIGDKVLFPGYRRNLLPVYASFDIFVMSSLREGLPNSILEAMAIGCPVVTTDVAGAKELVVDQETGFVVPQQAHEDLGHCITTLLDDKERRLYMGQAGRRRVEDKFSFSQRLRCIEQYYEQIVTKKIR